ncbi:MAG: iron-sulfur cluster insertion protein ErpA [Anaerolineaceae bacterium]|nr:MAG: iron-sulfur cluster insertion protein ErpA [Anaerolineaceae bacterium]
MAVNEPVNIENQVLYVTPTAAQTIQSLLQQREIPDYYLRVFVAGGGCSGLQYGMAFEASADASDTVVETGDVKLVVDPTSLGYLYGATIDFVDSLMGGGFRIDNPNSAGGCGCGKSFKAEQEQEEGTFEDSGGCGTCASY